MTSVLYRPGHELARVQDEMDRLFDSFLTAPQGRAGAWMPAVDVTEGPSGYTLRMDLPGVNPKDVQVRFQEETLTIRGERRAVADAEEGAQVHRRERFAGAFERAFTVSTPIRVDGVRASYKDGVLEVQLPKADEAKPREIAIEIA